MPIGSIVIYRDKTTKFTYVKTIITILRIVKAVRGSVRRPSCL